MHQTLTLLHTGGFPAIRRRRLETLQVNLGYRCNQSMLGLPLHAPGKARVKLADLIGRDLDRNPIVVRDHCFGCTAGQGSSCGGALSAPQASPRAG